MRDVLANTGAASRGAVEEAPSAAPLVVLVDDDPAVLAALRRLLRHERCELLATERAGEALDWVTRREVRLVVADQRMPGMTGTELLKQVALRSSRTARILLTAYPGQTVKLTSLEEGIFHLFYKPWNDETLKRTIRRLLEGKRAERPPSETLDE
jgi:DNA-binding NtrC family response regulator